MTARRLQEIAFRCFAEKGYEGTSLAEIAGEIGIKKPSIYAHYPSKMDLFLAVVEAAKSDYHRCWFEALHQTADLPPDERLRQIFRRVGLYFAADRVKKAFWIRIWIFPPMECPLDLSADLRDFNATFIRELARVFRQGMDAGALREGLPEDFAYAMFSMLLGFLLRTMSYPETAHERLLQQTWDIFATGIMQCRGDSYENG